MPEYYAPVTCWVMCHDTFEWNGTVIDQEVIDQELG